MTPSLIVSALALATASDAAPHDGIRSACEDRGGSAQACACVASHAAAMFTPAEADFVAIAMTPDMEREERSARLAASGLTSQDMASLTQRMVAAEPQIHAACGRGLLRADRR